MIWNYLKTALRSLRRQKLFTMINLLGLATGIAGFALFALTAGVKLNADRFHRHAERIQAVVQVAPDEDKEFAHSAFIPAPLLTALRTEISGIEDSLLVRPAGRVTISRGREPFYEDGALFVDANFLEFFTFALKAGDPRTALTDPHSVVISEELAAKYFGQQDAIGQELVLNNQTQLTVSAVVRRLPRTSSISFSMLIPLAAVPHAVDSRNNWQEAKYSGFVRLAPGLRRDDLEPALKALIGRHFSDPRLAPKRLYLFPLLDFRTRSSHMAKFWHSSNRSAIFITLFLGVLLLVVVSVNFVSLSTARYMQRAREIGMRKTFGARRFQLVFQFMSESLLLALLSLPLAVVIYEIVQPLAMNQDVLGFAIVSSNSIAHYPFLLGYMAAAALMTGLLSGIYPALALSAMRSIQTIRGSIQVGRKKHRFSKFMVVLQFSLALVFILAASVFREQGAHLLTADYGYDRTDIAVIPLNGEALAKKEQIAAEFSRRAEVRSISAAASVPILWSSPRRAEVVGRQRRVPFTMQAYGTDYGFIETMNMRLVRGRDFRRDISDRDSFILNEAAARKFGARDPLGLSIQLGDRKGVVVGVVRDFLFDDVGFRIPPAVLCLEPENVRVLLVKYNAASDFQRLRSSFLGTWNTLAPGVPFECQTMQHRFTSQFAIIEMVSNLFRAIGLVAIFFSCLGLLGLVSYLMTARTKAIAIHKVLGASTARVLWGNIREFLALVAIANVITAGLVYYGWSRVLRTGLLFFDRISAGTYLFAIGLTLISALLAVSISAIKAILANPVDSLRFE
jgi:putative ABC transport system permease protein